MTDLRDRLETIESTPPPDLWTEIEARSLEARPEPGDQIVAFEPRGRERPRRIAITAVAAAVFVLAAIPIWRASRPAPPPPVPMDELPAGWQDCTNGVEGYSIGYPGTWQTTDINFGDQDPGYACQWFSPDPFDAVDDQGRPQGNIVSEGYAYPMEVGVGEPLAAALQNRLEPEWVSDVGLDPPRVLIREDLVVDGHRAVRLEYETFAALIGSPGLHYEYLIELDQDRTLIIHTTATIYREPGGEYEENKSVLDLAVPTLRFADPLPGTLPPGWQRCENDRRYFDVGYPGEWYTTDIFFGERRREGACTIFASVPFELQTESSEPLGVVGEEGCAYPICIRFEPMSLDRLVKERTDPARIQVISRSDEVINGRRTVVLDEMVFEPTLGEDVGPYYEYLVELDDHQTLRLTTEARDTAVRDATGRTQDVRWAADFELYRTVLDQLVRTLRI
ncbi:MAG: hypothetical protein WD096_09225 [Actinomycetota bacterium]